MCCNSLDEQTILLSLFGNRALCLIRLSVLTVMEVMEVAALAHEDPLAQ